MICGREVSLFESGRSGSCEPAGKLPDACPFLRDATHANGVHFLKHGVR